MKILYDCLPCITRQVVELAEEITIDEAMQRKIIKGGLEKLSDMVFEEVPPYLIGEVHKMMVDLTGIEDPLEKEKEMFNKIAFELVDELNLESAIEKSDKPFETALRIAIAGNIIDFSVEGDLDRNDVDQSVRMSLDTPIFGVDLKEMADHVEKAEKILVIADNAGEIVFDKFLVQALPMEKVTYSVKGGPIVNDATMKDAIAVGMTDLVPVIDNGAAYQGTILKTCSESFKKVFDEADLIISKGQANYETLNDIKDKEIYFLLRAKCKAIANVIGCDKGAFCVIRG